jgi:hypothetical protein
MQEYAKLWLAAASTSLAILQQERPLVSNEPINKQGSWLLGVALMHFDFEYGDLIRWLGGEYTNAFCNWEEAFQTIDTVRYQKVPPGYPPVDFDRAYRACTEGIPLTGIFVCSLALTWKRAQ